MSPIVRFLLCLLLMASVGPSDADEQVLKALYSIQPLQYHRWEPQALGRAIHVVVKLPSSYAEAPDAQYPTVYLLDGGELFPILAGYQNYLVLQKTVPEAIVVGLSYGATDFEGGNMRSTDYTAPSDERDWWGGAAMFQQALRDELVPLIETNYRADPGRRVLFGQSLGGQFVLYSALTEPGLFWGRIASNPALHRNLPFFLQPPGRVNSADSKLFVASATADDPQFRQPARAWIEHWNAQESTPWTLRAVDIEGYGHFSLVTESYRQGMEWLFEQEE